MNISNGLARDTAPMRVLGQEVSGVAALSQQRCSRCGKTWWPRIVNKPKRCPRCKSPYWDRPRQGPAPRPAADFKALTKELQEKVCRQLGVAPPVEQPTRDQSLLRALLVMKAMKGTGRTWQEMAERVEREFGVRLDKEQLKALAR